MRLSVVYTLVAAMMATATSAADLPMTKGPPAPFDSPAYNWTGCYVGGNIGWAGGATSYALSPSGAYLNRVVGVPPNSAGGGAQAINRAALSNNYNADGSGIAGGVQIGCNKQIDHFVFGGEVDWEASNSRPSASAFYPAFADPAAPGFTDASHSESVSTRMDWFSTFRARAGYAWDRFLVYGTGGLAVASFQSDTSVLFGTRPAGLSVFNGAQHIGSTTQTRTGLALGGGFEWAFANSWSLKTEYLYLAFHGLNYQSPLVSAAAPFATGYTWNTHEGALRGNIVRVGVNYKFF